MRPEIVYVEWLDSSSPGGSVWVDAPAVMAAFGGALTCVSVGWVVGEDENVLGLAAHAHLESLEGSAVGDGEVSGVMFIPKCSIVRRVSLQTPVETT